MFQSIKLVLSTFEIKENSNIRTCAVTVLACSACFLALHASNSNMLFVTGLKV